MFISNFFIFDLSKFFFLLLVSTEEDLLEDVVIANEADFIIYFVHIEYCRCSKIIIEFIAEALELFTQLQLPKSNVNGLKCLFNFAK